MNAPRDLLLHSNLSTDVPSTLIAVDRAGAGWEYVSLRVVSLPAGESWSGDAGDEELGLVPLGGTCHVWCGSETWSIGGRVNPFAGSPSSLYLGLGSRFRVTADTDLELAICGSKAAVSFPAKLIPPSDVAVEIRGAGNAARQINHIIAPTFPADRLLIVEVFTPSGNWSSYPPHKHDVSQMPLEADLDEIYYYRIDPVDGFGLQRLYTEDGRIDEAYVIKDGDLLLVPEGYHAFCVAHGYTGYYLNILAGPEPVRTMQPIDDPVHHWVRATWDDAQNEGAASWADIARRVNRGAGETVQ